jgi:hypothetical protein
MSKARNLSDFISDATVDSTEIADLSVTHAKLHTDMNLSSKTLTFAANQISGNSVDGGVISNFASTGIDDNASATAVTILSDGKVGIGVSSPSEPLHVAGGAVRIGNTNIRHDGSGGSWDMKFETYSGGYFERMRIGSTGNVGIGIDNPLSPLHVFSGEIGNGANKGIRISNNSASQHYSIRTGIVGIENHSLAFYDDTAGANRMVISNGGNVGIGTNTPGRELHVYNATEANIKIQAGSDYAELRVKDSDDRFSMHYNGSQVIALDSNEIFIHKNTSAIGTQGAYFNSNYSHITSTNDSPITLNRLGNNNNLNYALDVRKDSTNAGGISVQDTWNSTKTSSFHPMNSHTYGYGLHGLNLHGYDVGRLDQSNTFDGSNQSGAYMPGIIGTSPKNMNYLEMHFQTVGDNVYRPFMINMNDVKGVLEIKGGDASSQGYKRWYVNYTSSAYGVYGITEVESVGGGWNSGSFSARVEAPNGALAVGFKFSSYYSTSAVASFKAIWRVI